MTAEQGDLKLKECCRKIGVAMYRLALKRRLSQVSKLCPTCGLTVVARGAAPNGPAANAVAK